MQNLPSTMFPVLPVVRCVPISRERWETLWEDGGYATVLPRTVERNFINREEGVARLTKIVDYLAKADRFHGVWPHWLHGPTGKVKPFGTKDDGGDLVESSFLMQSLLCVRQYVKDGNEKEKALAAGSQFRNRI